MGWVCINHKIGISIAREQGIYQVEHGYKHEYKLYNYYKPSYTPLNKIAQA